MSVGTATTPAPRDRVSAVGECLSLEQPDECRMRDGAAWLNFRERLREDLDATAWFEARPSDTLNGIVETAQRALMAANCTVFLYGHDHQVLSNPRAATSELQAFEACATPLRNETPLAVHRSRPPVGDHHEGQVQSGAKHDSREIHDRQTNVSMPRAACVLKRAAFEPRQDANQDVSAGCDLSSARAVDAGTRIDFDNTWLNGRPEMGGRSTIRELAGAIDAKDPYTCGHSQRVARYCMACGLVAGLNREAMRRLQTAAVLHDIGKIGIDDAILRKPGKLTAAEYALVKDHPIIGAALAQGVVIPREVVELILHHHERYDGRGYPHGLAAEDIPQGADIIAVADAFDSMTTGRPYRRAVTVNEAMRELLRCRGTQFCPETLDAFAIGFTRYYDVLPWSSGVLDKPEMLATLTY